MASRRNRKPQQRQQNTQPQTEEDVQVDPQEAEEAVYQTASEEDASDPAPVTESDEATEETDTDTAPQVQQLKDALEELTVTAAGVGVPSIIAPSKMNVATALINIVNGDDYEVFSEGWKVYTAYISDNPDGCLNDNTYENGLMYGLLPPAWVWGEQLRDRFVALSVLANEIARAEDIRKYLESRDIANLGNPPVSLSDKAVTNLSRFYNI